MLSIYLIYFGLYEIAQAANGSNIVTEYYSTSANSSAFLNVSVCNGMYANWFGVVDADLTWYDATKFCHDNGYRTIDFAQPSWSRRKYFRKYFETINYRNMAYTYWLGVIKPFQDLSQWYTVVEENCEPFRVDSVEGEDQADAQCLAARRNDSDKYKETVFAERCDRLHPFVCVKGVSDIRYMAYTGYVHSAVPENAYENITNITEKDCQDRCSTSAACTAATYLYSSRECVLLFHIETDVNFITYTISKTTDAVTHFAKTGCDIQFAIAINKTTNYFNSMDNYTQTCEPVDDDGSYCPCDSNTTANGTILSEEELNQVIEELVNNLTMNPKTTAASIRKHISAEDARTSSKTVGAVGIAVLVFVFSLPVIGDLFSLVKHFTYKRNLQLLKSGKRKKN